MKIKISILVIINIKKKLKLIQKKLLNHLKNYIINELILANLMKIIINLRMMLKGLKIIRLKKSQVVFP